MTEFKFGRKWNMYDNISLIHNGKSIGYISWKENNSRSGKKTWTVVWLTGSRRSSIELIKKLFSHAKEKNIDYIKPFWAGSKVKALINSLKKKNLIKTERFRGIVVDSIKLEDMSPTSKGKQLKPKRPVPPDSFIHSGLTHPPDTHMGRRRIH